jgi:hypothetical protein
MRWPVITGVALFVTSSLFVAHATSPAGAQAIILRSIQASNADWDAAPRYDYCERDREKDGTTTAHEEMMILGSPYARLLAVNGKPLSPEQQAQEEEKLRAVILSRRQESPQKRAQRVAEYSKERKRDHLLLGLLTKAMQFKLLGEQKLGSKDVYVLKGTPRPGFEPPNYEAEVLTGMQGELWVDKNTFQWVKIEASVIRPVSIEGFLARVEPGTRFELEKMPVGDGIWLPKHFAMKSKAKILFLVPHEKHMDETYYDYRKADSVQVDRANN